MIGYIQREMNLVNSNWCLCVSWFECQNYLPSLYYSDAIIMAGYDFFPDTTNSRLTLRSSVDHVYIAVYSVSCIIYWSQLCGGRDLSLLVTENTKLSSLSVKKQFSSTS